MKKYFYPAIFSKENNVYNVKFIDFNGIFTWSNSFEDAYYMAQDALYNMLFKYNDKLPEPTGDYLNNKINSNEFIIIVMLNVMEYEKEILAKAGE